MKRVGYFADVTAVEIEADNDARDLNDLWDSTFDIVLARTNGTKTRLCIRGGNGGAYGADLKIREEAAP